MPPEDPLHLPRRLFVELELRGMLLLLARLGASWRAGAATDELDARGDPACVGAEAVASARHERRLPGGAAVSYDAWTRDRRDQDVCQEGSLHSGNRNSQSIRA